MQRPSAAPPSPFITNPRPLVISPHPLSIQTRPSVIVSPTTTIIQAPVIVQPTVQPTLSTGPIRFTPEMVNDKTVIGLAQSLNITNFQNLLQFVSNYYHNNISIISDNIFDALIDIYEAKYGPYKIVGAEPTGQKVDLPYYLGSLRKIKDEPKLTSWLQKFPGPYLIEDKVDGLTLLLVNTVNTRGKPTINLYTRGGGSRGTDVSHLAPYLRIPVINENITIRGEIVMTKDSWSRVRADHKNPRNLVSGIVNAKKHFDPKLAQELTFYPYKILNQNLTPMGDIGKLIHLGFKVPNPLASPTLTYEILVGHLKQRKIDAPYEIDGLVVYQDVSIPYPAGKDPLHVVAFKQPTESGITTVLDVVWKASKERLLKPVVHYQPISLSGAKLQKASGYNARYIITNKIGPGSVIEVTRSGDVIPKIIKVLSPALGGPKYPDPAVHGKYAWNENQVEFVLLGDNDQVIASHLAAFLTKIGVKGIGPGRIKVIVQAGVKSIGDLIRVRPEQLVNIPGIGATIANQLHNDIQQKIKNISPSTIMAASGIFPNIGERRFEMIFAVYPDFLNWTRQDLNAIANVIASIKGFKALAIEIAKNLPAFDNWLKQHPEITIKVPTKPLTLSVQQQTTSSTTATSSLSGMTIVFSGFRDKQIESQIKERGGKVTTAVSRNTSLLVLKDVNDLKSKGQKAHRLGIPLISREAFIAAYLN